VGPARFARICSATLSFFAGAMLICESACGDDIDRIRGEIEGLSQQAETLSPRYLQKAHYKSAEYAAERLIDGENFYRVKDYQRAAIIFMDIIENYPDHSAYTDALFLYADSLFLSRNYLGARDWFRRVLDESEKPGMQQFIGKAMERLIETAIHLKQFEGVEQYFDKLGGVSLAESQYVKAKYLYFKGDLEEAGRFFSSVAGNRLLELKARYMRAVILTRQEKFKEAIEVFLAGQKFEPKTNEEREIVDLMNLGAGRLYYEQGLVEHASECYQRILKNSPYFDAALYEAASVLISAGDTIRAEQTLEVLTVAMPDSRYIPRAKMLRGNLLLRAGRYDEAEKVFNELVDEFTPVMDQLDEAILAQSDTREFFLDLVEQSLESLDKTSVLPPLVVKWVSEEQDVQRALELAGDLGTTKAHVKDTERLLSLLEAVIDGPSRVNAVPMLREAMRKAQQIGNRLGQLRGELSRIAENRIPGTSAELASLRKERRGIESKLAKLPTSESQFAKREAESQRIYERMRKELSRNAVRLDQLSAMAVAIDRFISDPRYSQGVSEENLEAARQDLVRHRQATDAMREEIAVLRNEVDSGRYQVGIGDLSDRSDTELKARMKKLAQEERRLLGPKVGEIGKRLEQVHISIDRTDEIVQRFERDIEAKAMLQVEGVQKQVRQERDRLAGYRSELTELSVEAEEVVGGVAYENFSSVRKRFHDLILKADVGIIDVAWLKKEEHTSRINELTKGRLNDIKALDDEFQEVRSGRKNGAH
jgi:tetratricopeptide (TPR) repeat protein